MVTDKKRVLFMCVGNSCRSQMAEGLLRALAGDKYEVASCGAVATGLSSRATKAMGEIGIDISHHQSQRDEEYEGHRFDYVITVCDALGEMPCPVFVGEAGERLHWPFDDPAYALGSEEEVMDVFRRVRDEIKAKLGEFSGRHK
ncbi:MAG: arsenate reductase ArsC [Planctomycetes bacterium]|nr:arsenate reductase ArsC [Planctomycetota bacterium]